MSVRRGECSKTALSNGMQEVKSLLIRDKVAERLRQGTPFSEVRREFPSVSQLYAGARQYLDEADKEISATQERLEKLRVATIEEENRRAELEVENGKLAEENMELTQKKMDLTQEVALKKEESRHLDSAVDKLRSRGYSPEIIAKIEKIEERNGSKALCELQTVEKFLHTKRELSKLRREEKALKKEVLDLKTERANLKESVVMHKNILDEIEVKVRAYEEAYSVAKELLENGYSVEDIVSLKSGLDIVQIRAKPKISIKRLVQGLIKAENLHTLDEKTEVAEKKLAVVKRETAETKQESKVVATTTIAAIECEEDAALKSIANVGAEAHARMETSTEKFEATLKRGEDKIQRIAEALKDGLEEYGSLQQEAGRLKQHNYYGRVLFGVLNSTDYLKTLPPTVVAEILGRMALWTRSNYPKFTVSPSPSVIQKENQLVPILRYNLVALVEFAAEGLRNLIQERVAGELGT